MIDWETKYYSLRSQIAEYQEREKRAKQTRFELLMELKQMTDLRDKLQEDFNRLLDQKSNPQGSQK